ncbi:hypothetical protein GCM10010266_21190 [Streptomyces griseomycini]|nr:hypothetical protein GCM10010266_21190 [Streptomyces griseomycini]
MQDPRKGVAGGVQDERGTCGTQEDDAVRGERGVSWHGEAFSGRTEGGAEGPPVDLLDITGPTTVGAPAGEQQGARRGPAPARTPGSGRSGHGTDAPHEGRLPGTARRARHTPARPPAPGGPEPGPGAPDDLSLVARDDSTACRPAFPPPTTTSVDAHRYGVLVA